MTDPYATHSPSASGPARRLFDVVPNDATDLSHVTTAVYAGTGGNLTVRDLDGQTVTFRNVIAGTYLPIRVSRIMATGTSVANIVGMA